MKTKLFFGLLFLTLIPIFALEFEPKYESIKYNFWSSSNRLVGFSTEEFEWKKEKVRFNSIKYINTHTLTDLISLTFEVPIINAYLLQNGKEFKETAIGEFPFYTTFNIFDNLKPFVGLSIPLMQEPSGKPWITGGSYRILLGLDIKKDLDMINSGLKIYSFNSYYLSSALTQSGGYDSYTEIEFTNNFSELIKPLAGFTITGKDAVYGDFPFSAITILYTLGLSFKLPIINESGIKFSKAFYSTNDDAPIVLEAYVLRYY